MSETCRECRPREVWVNGGPIREIIVALCPRHALTDELAEALRKSICDTYEDYISTAFSEEGWEAVHATLALYDRTGKLPREGA